MNYRNVCITGLLAACLALAAVVVAQRANIDPSQHPSLAEAQQHILEATKKIHEAHERDKSDLGGHAEKAIQLLDQASMEVKSASLLTNRAKRNRRPIPPLHFVLLALCRFLGKLGWPGWLVNLRPLVLLWLTQFRV